MTGTEFLAWLNRDSGYTNLAFTQPIDNVVEGGCSFYNEVGPRCVEACLAHEVDRFPNARRVLVYARCCGNYETAKQSELRQSNPELELLFPRIPDFCDSQRSSFVAEELAPALLEAKILRED